MRETADEKATRERERDVLDSFKDKKKRYQDHWKPIYERAQKRKRFALLGKQLSGEEKKRYGWKNPKEPNLLLTYVNHEANKTLQTDYLGKVSPNGGGSSLEMARVRQSVLRGVQRKAGTTAMLNYARRDQVASGIGYALVTMGYAGKRGFGKTLKDEYLEDTYNVFPDADVKESTFSDARDFLIKKQIPESKWKDETGEKPTGWGGKKTKALWYYWVREDVEDTEFLLEDGESGMASKLKGDDEDDESYLDKVKKDENGDPLSRPTTDYTWTFYKISDEDERILDEEQWAGSYCPLVAFVGRRVVDEKETYYQPITEFAEEAQTMYTILENIIALRLAKSPFSKWKVAFESIDIKAFADLRQNAVVGDMDVLYKAFTADGKLIPQPEEIEPHILDAILIQLQQAQEMKIQKIFGIFDANLGNKSNEQSGVAIEQRAKGGEISNYDSQYNFMLSVEQLTRVKLDLIPKVLTLEQQAAFVDKDDPQALQWLQATAGKMVDADEEYDLAIEATPISDTDRGEEAQALMNMVDKFPSMAQNPKIAAVIAKALPGRYAAEVSQILSGTDPQTQEAKQAMQKAQQENQALQQKLQQAQGQQQQAAQVIGGLKNTLAGMKQTIGMLKQQHAIESQTSELQTTHDAIGKQIDDMNAALDRQVEQYKAENGRVLADAAMLKVVGALAQPDPATPGLGEGMP